MKQEDKELLLKDLCGRLPYHPFFKGEQNIAEWSEEDEKLYTWCASAIQTRYNDGLFTMDEYRETSLWLKSLKERVKPQNTWKPSDEQMHYLSWIANIKLGDSVVEQEVSKHLNELLEDLKKLREE